MSDLRTAVPSSNPRGQHTASRLLRNARRIAAAFLIVELILAVITGPNDFRNVPFAYVILGLAICVLSYVIVRPTPRREIWVMCAVLCGLQLANLAPTDAELAVSTLIGWARLSGWMIALSFNLRESSIGLAISGLLNTAIMLVSAALVNDLGDQWRSILLIFAAGFASAMGLASVCAAVGRAARYEDAAAQARLDSQRSIVATRTRRDEINRISWALHDTVVNTLYALANGVHSSQVEALKQRCANDVRAVRRWLAAPAVPDNATYTSAGIARWLQIEVETRGLTMNVHHDGGNGVVNQDALEATLGAGREALVNATKHATTATVTVTVALSAARLNIVIRDDGPGFDVASTRMRGIETSISERCQRANVDAQLTSMPGAGTTLTMNWAPEFPTSQRTSGSAWSADAARLRAGVRTATTATVYWLLALSFAPILASDGREEFFLRLAGWLPLAAISLVTTRSMRRGTTAWPPTYALIGAASAWATYAYAAAPGDALGTIDGWAYTPGLVAMAVVAATAQKLIWLMFVWACGVVGLLIAMGPRAADLLSADPTSAITLLNIAPLLVLFWSIHRFAGGSIAAREFHQHAESVLLLDEEQVRAASRIERLQFADSLILPFLSKVADGTLDSQTTECREAARDLESLARSILSIPESGPRLEAMLARLSHHAYRQRLTLRFGLISLTDDDVSVERIPAIEYVVDRVIAASPERSTVTVSARQMQGAAAIELVCDGTPEPIRLKAPADLDVTMTTEDEQLHVAMHWNPTGETRSPSAVLVL